MKISVSQNLITNSTLKRFCNLGTECGYTFHPHKIPPYNALGMCNPFYIGAILQRGMLPYETGWLELGAFGWGGNTLAGLCLYCSSEESASMLVSWLTIPSACIATFATWTWSLLSCSSVVLHVEWWRAQPQPSVSCSLEPSTSTLIR